MPVHVQEGYYLLHHDGRLEYMESARFAPNKKIVLKDPDIKAHFYVKTSGDYNAMMQEVSKLRKEIQDGR